jgi:hypothetical protein
LCLRHETARSRRSDAISCSTPARLALRRFGAPILVLSTAKNQGTPRVPRRVSVIGSGRRATPHLCFHGASAAMASLEQLLKLIAPKRRSTRKAWEMRLRLFSNSHVSVVFLYYNLYRRRTAFVRFNISSGDGFLTLFVVSELRYVPSIYVCLNL